MLENCFKVRRNGSFIVRMFVADTGTTDLEYVIQLLNDIEKKQIPAPGPIEQRWTRGSDSLLSAASKDKTR